MKQRIEIYSDKRLKEFLRADRLPKKERSRIKKRFELVASKFSKEAAAKSVSLRTLLRDLQQLRRKNP